MLAYYGGVGWYMEATLAYYVGEGDEGGYVCLLCWGGVDTFRLYLHLVLRG